MHLVQFVARKLHNLFPGLKVVHADRALALTHLRALENFIDRATKLGGLSLDETLIGDLIVSLTLSDGFTAHNREPALVLEFATAHEVIFEIVELTKLVLNEIEVDHSVFENVLAVGVIDAFITAAGDNGIDEEDRKPCNHEYRVLQHEDDQPEVEQSGAVVGENFTDLETFDVPLLIVLHQVNSHAVDDAIDSPLDCSPGSEAAITARLEQEAVAEQVVDSIVDAEASGHTSHLTFKAQIDEQVHVEGVVDREDAANDHHH